MSPAARDMHGHEAVSNAPRSNLTLLAGAVLTRHHAISSGEGLDHAWNFEVDTYWAGRR